ncbi:hypothetical protein C2S51_026941 [Perilla frutescens var. frutescens]|nr:hypothetical protein C2S51_026941 [Perilla frutescens var. frutescens]
MGLSELVPGLYSVLEQRKCVIVIDDIWEARHWDILKPAFPMNCKVILTTRNENIITTYEECCVYKLDFLNEDEGWELLGKIALPVHGDAKAVLETISKSLEDVGRQIVEKCGRLPLAISVMGGILRQKQQILAEWVKVTEKEKFLKRIDDTAQHQCDIPSSCGIGPSTHRIALNLDDAAVTLCKSRMRQLEDLRSFLVLYKNRFSQRRTNFENIVNLENSKHLRILVLDRLEFEGRKLPSTIDVINLMNLQKLTATIEEDRDSLSEIVEYMSANGCQLRQTDLTVECCELSRNVVKKMLMSPSLTSLDIRQCEIGHGFPCYQQGMCRNLVKLRIVDSKIGGNIDAGVVEELGKYPILQYLWFRGKEQMMNTEMRFGVNSFPELKMLYLGEMLNMKKWEVEKGAMPKLEDLVMYECSNLEKFPDGLRLIPTL